MVLTPKSNSYTKDNLAKRNWTGCKKCVFCDSEESINHLFFACPFARLIWRVVQFTFDIPSPTSVTNMFRNWLNGVEKQTNARIRVGVCALIWALWNCRNDMVFNKTGTAHFLQVIHMATYWTREWSCLSPEAQWSMRTTIVVRFVYDASAASSDASSRGPDEVERSPPPFDSMSYTRHIKIVVRRAFLYGFWMQPSGDGCSSYLQPEWLMAY
jgi:hypothetical protein